MLRLRESRRGCWLRELCGVLREPRSRQLRWTESPKQVRPL